MSGGTEFNEGFHNDCEGVVGDLLHGLGQDLGVGDDPVLPFPGWRPYQLLDLLALGLKHHEQDARLDLVTSSDQILCALVDDEGGEARPDGFRDGDWDHFGFRVVSVEMEALEHT